MRRDGLVVVPEVAAAIRTQIRAGDLAPGQRLFEPDLVTSLGVSRTVVRMALAQLEHEGLIERRVNRGARVRRIDIDEAIHLAEVRMVVEGLCAARAARHASDDDLAALRTIGAAMTSAVRAADTLGYSDLNVRLHEAIPTMARQPEAVRLLAELRARTIGARFRLALRPGRPRVSLPEHLAIIDAICGRDADSAEYEARQHVAGVIGVLRTEERPRLSG